MHTSVAVKVPLRLSLAGGGTDLEPFATNFGSRILNFAIDIFTHIEFSIRAGNTSINVEIADKYGVIEAKSGFTQAIEDYIQSKSQFSGEVKVKIANPVRRSSGLGTSSAMIVGLIYCLNAVRNNTSIPKEKLVTEAFSAERIHMGIAGGFQDYFPSVYGGINWVEQMPKSSEWHHNHLQLHKNLMDLLSTNLVCIELNIKRESEKIINDQIEKSNITNSQTQRALVQQYENALEIKSAGLSGNIDHFLNCIDKSFKLKKDYSPYVTNERILIAEQVLRDLGARGVKLSGAGGGGHMFGFFPEGIPKDIESKLPNFMTRINCNLEKRGIHET